MEQEVKGWDNETMIKMLRTEIEKGKEIEQIIGQNVK